MNMGSDSLQPIHQFLEQKREEYHAPGIALAVTDSERTLYETVTGYADIERQIPLSISHRFEIGSISKSFASIAILQLAEKGILSLDDPVEKILPIFKVRSQFEPIRLWHLLSHTAGITSGTDLCTDGRYEVWALRNTEAAEPPDEYYHYSNVGYRTLGLILEKYTGHPCSQVVEDNILQPLGMLHSSASVRHAIRENLAVGYTDLYDDRPYPTGRPLVRAPWVQSFTADGNIISTAEDMALYLRMLLNRGIGPNGPILSGDSFERLIEPVIWDAANSSHYALGLRISTVNGVEVVKHTGSMVGYVSAIQVDLHSGVGLAVLINGPGNADEIASWVMQNLRCIIEDGVALTLPPARHPWQISNPVEYAGDYSAVASTLQFEADGERLYLQYEGQQVTLEERRRDAFYADHPDFRHFLLRFKREDGKVVSVMYGSQVFGRGKENHTLELSLPDERAAYPGHYRSHNPWFPSVRVLLRSGELILVYPQGDEERLVEVQPGVFRGEDLRSPERVRFDTIEDGACLHMNVKGNDFYRSVFP
jgi:D-alanyl-D-alanine carboxypeptidase